MAKVIFSKPGGPASLVAPAPANGAAQAENVAPGVAGTAAPATVTGVSTPKPPPDIAAPVTQTATAPVSAVSVVGAPSLAVAAPQPPAFFDDESFEAGDLVLPRLSIVQKVGELSNQFKHGSIVLNSSLVLAQGGDAMAQSSPIKIVVLGFQPTIFTERVEGGLRGNMFKSEAEVAAANGTLDWNEHKATGKKLYQRLATALIAIEAVAGVDAAMFPNEFDGKRYALGLYSMKGTAYTNAAKHFKSARKIGHLREHGYRGGYWSFSSQLKKFENNYAFIPVVRPGEATTEAFRAAVKDLLGL